MTFRFPESPRNGNRRGIGIPKFKTHAMAIPVVEFSRDTKLKRFLAKNQHTQRKY
jgi:hypothetical protein